MIVFRWGSGAPIAIFFAFAPAPFAVAEALQTALLMPIEERLERWRSMIEILRRQRITAWRESFLRALSG